MISGLELYLELGTSTDGFCHLQGDVGPPGPRGAAGVKGGPVSEGKVFRGLDL